MSIDNGEVVDLGYDEEASYGANDEICYSSQEEDSISICESSCESDAIWEEESNDESVFSHASNGMVSCSKSESDNASQFLCHTNQSEYEELEGICL